jgi:beta-galactosidase
MNSRPRRLDPVFAAARSYSRAAPFPTVLFCTCLMPIRPNPLFCFALLLASLGLSAGPATAQRTTLSLDGEWQLEDSELPHAMPTRFTHTVPVPGMANLATPPFPDMDYYMTWENIYNQFAFGFLDRTKPVPKPGTQQKRNWFWYRKTFTAPAAHPAAILKINKAQFSTAVWLNGKKIGDYLGCYTASIFPVASAINWGGENTLVVRVGAHPGVMPEDVPSGTDFEKTKWTAGIYDSVSIAFSSNPVIETVQVAPRIQPPSILVQSVLRNHGATDATYSLAHVVKPAQGAGTVLKSGVLQGKLAPGESRTLTQTIAMPGARQWSPEDPYLYLLETTSGGDSKSTRFGVREFRFDTATRRAYLNGKLYFMRGSNITLHRFFEDPNTGNLPWNETWVRKMLVELPKWMNWNSFRFCIGAAPEKWYDIADEAGLLIQDEFFLWTGGQSWKLHKRRAWNVEELTAQYKDWLRDNWNHPSVVIWDANNETEDPIFHEKIIPAVRPLDLSNRPWENSYNLPAGPDDPVEDHPYLFNRGTMGPGKIFDMRELESMSGAPRAGATKPHGRALILNEYGWLWLLRDGEPCVVSRRIYDTILGPQATPAERIELNHYYLAGLTEYWRAWRHYAGVMHFVWLTFCYPNAYTCDNFGDVVKLELHEPFKKYVREAFKPLGLYINFWQPSLKPEIERSFHVMMVNDYESPVTGNLALRLEDEHGTPVAALEQPFSNAPWGQQTLTFKMKMPAREGKYILKAIATPLSGPAMESTTSLRKLTLTSAVTPAPRTEAPSTE